MSVGQRLSKARKAMKMSGETAGKLIGVSKGQISNIENDTSQLMKGHARGLADALGINEEWLLTGEGEMKKSEQKKGDGFNNSGTNNQNTATATSNSNPTSTNSDINQESNNSSDSVWLEVYKQKVSELEAEKVELKDEIKTLKARVSELTDKLIK